jgi:hypothetical protein
VIRCSFVPHDLPIHPTLSRTAATRCRSFTRYNSEYTQNTSLVGACFGHTDWAWVPIAAPSGGVDAGQVQWFCESAMDCSLNGKCVCPVTARVRCNCSLCHATSASAPCPSLRVYRPCVRALQKCKCKCKSCWTFCATPFTIHMQRAGAIYRAACVIAAAVGGLVVGARRCGCNPSTGMSSGSHRWRMGRTCRAGAVRHSRSTGSGIYGLYASPPDLPLAPVASSSPGLTAALRQGLR